MRLMTDASLTLRTKSFASFCARTEMTSQELAEYLLEHAGIALVAGTVFGDSGEGYLRMSFANSYENIVEGCRRLREAAEELMK